MQEICFLPNFRDKCNSDIHMLYCHKDFTTLGEEKIMDFRKIEYFLKSAELLNFTKASKELYISPQALTQQISLLEQELGVKLFHRNTRNVTLTEAGLFCYQKFAPVKSAYEQAKKDVQLQFSKQTDTIRIGFFRGLPKNELVTPWLNLILSHFPEVKLEITATDLSAIWKDLNDDKLDICLTNIDTSFPLENYETCELRTAPAQIVVSSNHPWACKDFISAADIEQGEMLQLRNDNELFQSDFYNSIKCRVIHAVTDFDSMLVTLENGKYFAVFPPIFEFQKLAKFKYFSLPTQYDFTFSTICAIKKHSSSKNVRLLFEIIRSNYQAKIDNL